MRIRIHFLFFIFLISLSIYALATERIPSIHIRRKTLSLPSLSSGPKLTLSAKHFSKTGANTLSEALQQADGVQIIETTGNGSQAAISLRGFGGNASSNTLLLIDGMPITNPDLAPPDLNTIPLYSIEYIEVTAGSESVLYGDQAVGGVINLITNKSTQDRLNISCGAGSYNTQQCAALGRYHYQHWRYALSLDHKSTDNYRDHNGYEQNLASGSLQLLSDKHKLKFNFQVAKESMQYPGALTLAQVQTNRRQANNDTDFFKDNNDLLHLSYKAILNPNWYFKTDVAHRGMDGNGVLFSPFTQNRSSYFIKPQLHGKWRNVSFQGGVDGQVDQYQLASAFGVTQSNLQKYSVFALANYPWSAKIILSLGARGAQQMSSLTETMQSNALNRAFASTIGATYFHSSDLQFYLRRAESFRFPKVDENAFSENDMNLRTQRGAAYETGMKWKKNNYLANIEVYQLNLRDEIAFDPLQTPTQPFGSNRNLSPTIRRGVSMSLADKITNKFTLGGQINYVNARYQNGTFANNRIPLVSELLANAHVNYAFNDALNFFAEAMYTGNQYAANDDANTAGIIAGYTIFNANLRYRYQHFYATFRVNNIFNKLYNFYTVFQPSMLTTFYYPAPERNIMLTLNYDFL